MSYQDTRTILETIRTTVAGIALPVTFGDSPLDAFEDVRFYDVEDAGKALEELLVIKHRAAFILFDGPTHENEAQGAVLFSRRLLDVTILITDRNYRNRQTALMGDASTPGVILLSELLVDTLTETLTGDIVGFPDAGRPFQIERKDHPARICWQQDFQFHGGSKTVALPRGFAT